MREKRIDETMLCVRIAEHHRCEIPASILAAAQTETALTAASSGCLERLAAEPSLRDEVATITAG